jgi:hypothetical protein
MKHRNPIMVIILTLITLGIYGIAWHVMTKNEMNTKGAKIPTAWLYIIPIVNIYWLWKFSEGVELVTNKEMTTVVSFLLMYFLGMIGGAIVQDKLNAVSN